MKEYTFISFKMQYSRIGNASQTFVVFNEIGIVTLEAILVEARLIFHS